MEDKLADYISMIILNNFDEIEALDDDVYYHSLIKYVIDYFVQFDVNKILNGEIDSLIIELVSNKLFADGLFINDHSSGFDEQIEIFKKLGSTPKSTKEKSNEEVIEKLIKLRDSIAPSNQSNSLIFENNLVGKKSAVYKYLEELSKKYKLTFEGDMISVIMNVYIREESYDIVLNGELDGYLEYIVISCSKEFKDVKSQVLNMICQDIRYNSFFKKETTNAMNDISCMLVRKGHKTIAEDDMDEIDDIIDFYFGMLSIDEDISKKTFREEYDKFVKKIKSITPQSVLKNIGIGVAGTFGLIMLPYLIIPGAYYLYKNMSEREKPNNYKK